MRPHRRRGPIEHVLVAGDLEELTAIQALMLLIPPTAYGQVFVETPAGVALPALTTPLRVTVTQLARGQAAESGELLADAVHAWLAEWTPEDPDPDRAFTLWVGASSRNRVNPSGATLQNL